jgi:Cu/Ag efflux pump CusA
MVTTKVSGVQEGGEILQPLAVAVIGDMPIYLIATLLVLPTLALRYGRFEKENR